MREKEEGGSWLFLFIDKSSTGYKYLAQMKRAPNKPESNAQLLLLVSHGAFKKDRLWHENTKLEVWESEGILTPNPHLVLTFVSYNDLSLSSFTHKMKKAQDSYLKFPSTSLSYGLNATARIKDKVTRALMGQTRPPLVFLSFCIYWHIYLESAQRGQSAGVRSLLPLGSGDVTGVIMLGGVWQVRTHWIISLTMLLF